MNNDIQPIDAAKQDVRLYIPMPDGWEARIKHDSERDYCYYQNPGEDYFHLLIAGEIFLQRGTERCCLSCALRHGIVTTDRLNWQHGGGGTKSMPL